MLLQSSQTHKTGNPAKAKAYHVLKGVARKHHSLRMAAKAAMVQTATEGHFDVVIGSVDKMIAELRAEEQDDIDLRDYCQDAENKVETRSRICSTRQPTFKDSLTGSMPRRRR